MHRFKNILCIITAGSENKTVLQRATDLAATNQASLTIVKVIEKIPTIKLQQKLLISDALVSTLIDEQEKDLQTQVKPWAKNLQFTTKILIGTPFLEIIHEVLRNNHDLIIKSAESEDLLDRVFGSDDMHLLRKCPCPVWLVKPKATQKYPKILAAVDIANEEDYPSDELITRHKLNVDILKIAGSLAEIDSSQLHIINVWDAIGEGIMRSSAIPIQETEVLAYVEETRQQQKHNLQQLLDQVIPLVNQGKPIPFKAHMIKGSARDEIPNLAKQLDIDLVVMGTVARTGISGFFMGNTAETILNRLDCSVLAIKPADFKTPVSLDD
ncbi:MAG: universal stress protein [Methylococcaceae bacterium]|nr:universal stress protein [Methylococcaceae bacterium]